MHIGIVMLLDCLDLVFVVLLMLLIVLSVSCRSYFVYVRLQVLDNLAGQTQCHPMTG
jgi:hypothetical protein